VPLASICTLSPTADTSILHHIGSPAVLWMRDAMLGSSMARHRCALLYNRDCQGRNCENELNHTLPEDSASSGLHLIRPGAVLRMREGIADKVTQPKRRAWRHIKHCPTPKVRAPPLTCTFQGIQAHRYSTLSRPGRCCGCVYRSSTKLHSRIWIPRRSGPTGFSRSQDFEPPQNTQL
jgi:hypothetical protein